MKSFYCNNKMISFNYMLKLLYIYHFNKKKTVMSPIAQLIVGL